MKAIKVLTIALLAAFTFGTVNAQEATAPAKVKTEKTTKKPGHKKHHKHKGKKAAKA
ncbi:hypothetical protein [Pedobacter nototheniae]|uniref:hypothetical protein n=1 Tax=Pedobacter nototheniae TaxID=2488994 RepID=UPI0029318C11|nr:hypothetical protein [Pedobacter nototheniae]